MLIRGAHVIMGDGQESRGADLLIEHGRITRISTAPLDATGPDVIDASGRTVLPGLIDAHLHFDFLSARNGVSGWWRGRQHAATLRELLSSGVTAVRTMADPLAPITRLRKQVASGRLTGPHLVVAGPAITAPGGHPEITVCRDNPWLQKHMVRAVADPDRARAAVGELATAGVDVIKIVAQGGTYAEFGDELTKLSDASTRAVIDEAHARGLRVSAHTHYQDDVELLLGLGVDSIEHGVIEEPIDDADGFLGRWADSGIPLVSTLTIAQLVRDGSGQQYLATASENVRTAHEAGVRIVAGTDSMVGAMSADSLHEELRLLVDAGLPPAAAIEAATRNAADLLGLGDRGRIAEGMIADLLVLDADPLESIDATVDVALVIQGGRIAYERPESARVELAGFAVPDEPVRRFLDGTGGAFDREVAVEVDSSRFTAEGLRTITYTEPATGELLRTETLRSGPTLLTEEWTCRVPAERTDITARLIGQRIELTGTFQGSTESRSYPLRGRRWMQGMVFDAATFVTTSGTVLDLVAVGTTGRGALEASSFELTKDETPSGQEISATLVMPRWRRFWSAEARFEPSTGELVHYEVAGRKPAVLRRA